MKQILIITLLILAVFGIWRLVVYILTPGWINYYEMKERKHEKLAW